MGTHEKVLVNLCTTPFIPGAEVTVLTDGQRFAPGDISQINIDAPWPGIVPLTLVPYNAGAYAAYTAVAPPAFGDIMFDADRTHFKCGTALWMGKITAYIIPVGSRVLTS